MPSSPAWSTSKLLVVAAFLDTVADDDPERLSRRNDRLIGQALASSDLDALLELRGQISGRPGRAMTR